MKNKKTILFIALGLLAALGLVLLGFGIAGYDIIKMITQPAVLTVLFIVLGGITSVFFFLKSKNI